MLRLFVILFFIILTPYFNYLVGVNLSSRNFVLGVPVNYYFLELNIFANIKNMQHFFMFSFLHNQFNFLKPFFSSLPHLESEIHPYPNSFLFKINIAPILSRTKQKSTCRFVLIFYISIFVMRFRSLFLCYFCNSPGFQLGGRHFRQIFEPETYKISFNFCCF